MIEKACVRTSGSFWVVVIAALLSLMALGIAAPQQAQAAQGDSSNGLAAGRVDVSAQGAVAMREDIELWVGNTYDVELNRFLNYDAVSPIITKVTSSNKAVLQVKKINNYKDPWSYEVHPKKAGTATLSVTYKTSSKAKAQTIKATYTVKKFTDGIASVKLNGKKLAVPTSKAANTEVYFYEFSGTKATLNITTANGWELGNIWGYFYNQNGGGNDKNIEITNGKQFTIPKGYRGQVSINLYNENTDDYFSYNLWIVRNKPLVLSKSTYYIAHPAKSMLWFKDIENDAQKAKIVSVTSSKPSVMKVTKGATWDKIRVQPKKVGKSTITVKYKLDGKNYTTKAVQTVAAYPLKSVAVNGKNLNLKTFYNGRYYNKYKKTTAKVKVTTANGWKIKEMRLFNGTKYLKVKNGASFKTPNKKMSQLLVTVVKKGAKPFTYYLDFDRIG